MLGRRLLLVVVATTLLAGACSDSSEPARGTADRLEPAPPSAIVGHPDPDEWRVEVARAEADVDEIVVHRELPPDAELDPPAPTRASTVVEEPRADLALSVRVPDPGKPALTPIPSPSLNWGSRAVDVGWAFDNPTVIGSPLVFLVTGNHGDWLEVMAPVRPNQQEGWIRADDVELSSHEWHVTVDVTTNHLEVFEGDELRFESGTVDGAPHAPTPLGRFYINEKQPVAPSSPYGSWILSTNGFSDSLERFSGEVPIFAIHGTPHEASLGQDISNGCIRVPNAIIEQMAEHVPAGTPVDVVA